MYRSILVRGLVLAAGLAVVSAQAQNYPSRPVRILVPLTAGGGMDTVTRSLADQLTNAFNQTVVVDNRPGAGSQVALDILSGAAPDGHTAMMLSATTIIYPLLYKSRFELIRDFTPVSQVTAQGYVLVVHPSIPAKNALDLVKYIKANPDKLTYASSGIGSPIHMTTVLFQLATGTKMTHIPYKGMGSAYADLVGGRINLSFATVISSQVHVKAGKLRAIAISTPKRAPAMPDVPTLGEAGVPGVVVVNWYGLIMPKGTPSNVVERFAGEVAKAANSPQMQKRLVAEGSEGVGSKPAEFAQHIREESAMWTKVIKEGGIRTQ